MTSFHQDVPPSFAERTSLEKDFVMESKRRQNVSSQRIFEGNSTLILDLLFTNSPDLIKETSVVSGVSDHEAVLSVSQLQIKHQKQQKNKIRFWNKANITKMKTDATKSSQTFLSTCTKMNVNDMWSHIKTNLLNILDDNVPSKLSSSKTFHPWITTEIKRLIRNKQIWYQKAKKRNDEKSWKKYNELKKLVQKQCRKSHDVYVQDLITNDKSNKKFWTYIKSQRKEKTGIPDILDRNAWVTDPKQKANLFNAQFSGVFSTPGTPFTIPPLNSKCKLSSIQVSKKGVLKLLENINVNKAPGPDQIPGKLLRIIAEEIHEVLTVLFQKSLDHGSVPEDWKTALITPLFKKADKNDVQNYRPISLTSIICKLLEHIIHSTIMDFVDSNNILTDFQHGFRQGRSCESQLITTIRDFSNSLNASSQVDAILLDFSKAFDKVDHSILLSKMYEMGIQGPLLSWSASFLQGRTQRVAVDGSISDPCPVLSGVPQGTVLGPLFFLLYINDIQRNLSPGTHIRLFADDSLLYRTISNNTDAKILQTDLNTLQQWESNNKMEFHPEKCTLLRITNKREPITNTYTIHNVVLDTQTAAKYLGVTIDNQLNWDDHCNTAYRKASSMLSFLERNIQKCPRQIKENCYNALVRPILEYGCCVWDPHKTH